MRELSVLLLCAALATVASASLRQERATHVLELSVRKDPSEALQQLEDRILNLDKHVAEMKAAPLQRGTPEDRARAVEIRELVQKEVDESTSLIEEDLGVQRAKLLEDIQDKFENLRAQLVEPILRWKVARATDLALSNNQVAQHDLKNFARNVRKLMRTRNAVVGAKEGDAVMRLAVTPSEYNKLRPVLEEEQKRLTKQALNRLIKNIATVSQHVKGKWIEIAQPRFQAPTPIEQSASATPAAPAGAAAAATPTGAAAGAPAGGDGDGVGELDLGKPAKVVVEETKKTMTELGDKLGKVLEQWQKEQAAHAKVDPASYKKLLAAGSEISELEDEINQVQIKLVEAKMRKKEEAIRKSAQAQVDELTKRRDKVQSEMEELAEKARNSLSKLPDADETSAEESGSEESA